MKEEDDDYGAELDAIEEKTEKKIEKKQTSMFAQAAANVSNMQNQPTAAADEKNDSGIPTPDKGEMDEMENMMSQLFGGLGGADGSMPAGNIGSDPGMPDIAGMMKMFGSLGSEDGQG